MSLISTKSRSFWTTAARIISKFPKPPLRVLTKLRSRKLSRAFGRPRGSHKRRTSRWSIWIWIFNSCWRNESFPQKFNFSQHMYIRNYSNLWQQWYEQNQIRNQVFVTAVLKDDWKKKSWRFMLRWVSTKLLNVWEVFMWLSVSEMWCDVVALLSNRTNRHVSYHPQTI